MRIPFRHSLRFKIGSGYIVLVALNIIVTAWTIYNFGILTRALNSILNENYPNVMVVENMARSIEHHERSITLALNRDVDSGRTQFGEARSEFLQWFQAATDIQTVPEAGPILENINSTYQGYVLVSDSLFLLAGNGRFVDAKAYYNNILRPFSQRLTENCFWLIEENQKEMTRVATQTKLIADEAIIAVLIGSLLAAGLSIMTMIQFTRRIIEPAERLFDTVYRIGRGRLDLKIDVVTNDEVGELSREFNKMTERLRVFEELNIEKILSEKKKSETIVESISDAILVTDPERRIQVLNRSAEELLGLDETAAIGKRIDETVKDRRLLEIFARPSDPALINEPYLQFSYRGRQVFLRPRVSVIPALHGGMGGLVLVLQDVTQYKELDKMKSDFMAAVSHEFRTPLTSINMGVDLLRQRLLGPLTPPQHELLESAKQDCERLTKLVRELLQLSKLESGRIELREELVDMCRVIDATVQPVRLQFQEKGVELVVAVPAELPCITGDEQQLSWVISNLVNNALKHTPAGGKVEVRALRNGENLLVQVEDTGEGIPPEFLGKIFDKFVQAKQALDPTPGSVGLGLAIAKQVVEMYGGKIWVESEVHKGTVFSFRIPVALGQPA